ncbi:ABC transporter permease [Candidatus Woesearchaeota archaeon]|nr:ABC transporter permease [Candidatus Woesearchaeota archaeon]
MIGQINYAVQNLLHRKTRSWLTILSILMGITAIYAILSFGYGIQDYMDTLAEEAGADKLYVQARSIGAPGTDDTFSISKDEFEYISKIKGVNEIAPMYMKIGEIEHKGEKIFNWLLGYDPKDYEFLFESFTADVERGRPLKKGDTYKLLLGYNYQVADEIFKKPVNLGDKLLLNGVTFEVVGFVSKIGNPSDDGNIYISLEATELLYPGAKDKYAMVLLSSDKTTTPKDLADRIMEKLRKYKGQEEGNEDFYVQTFEDIIQTFGTIINVLNGVLVLIAFISLIVAFVNIMNTMYTSVLERTNEIGVMKAIGARNSDILFIFVFESGLLGLIGGMLGIVAGYFVASFGGMIAAASGYTMLKPVFPIGLTIACAVFAFITGALAGLLPARRASKLNPIDALRYE